MLEKWGKKVDGCLPGYQNCNGFQEIFGGPKYTVCKPWDMDCTLNDQFSAPPNAELLDQRD